MSDIKELSASLSFSDIIGGWKARWGINRMNYTVAPGLYKTGNPGEDSPVLATANYKMTVDSVRKELRGIDAWLLILDTKGVNVWCAAGKGTFGTKELIKRIYAAKLSQVVNHKNIIVPQLGAVGVSAHDVKKAAKFNVVYGPVRAKDIPKFLKNNMHADKEMRTVRFNIIDRTVLAPMEIAGAAKPTLLTLGILFLASALGITKASGRDARAYVGSVLVGTVLVPVFLPFIPSRAFSLKGWLLGMVWALCVCKKDGLLKGASRDLAEAAKYMLVLPSVSAIYAFGFTGCTTYTSMSGVQKEAKIAVPLIGLSLFAGIIFLLKAGRARHVQ